MGEGFGFVTLCILLWGIWGLLPKLSIKYIDPKSALLFEILGGLFVGAIILFFLKFQIQTNFKGMTFAMLTGIAGFLGALFFLFAMSKVNSVVVVTASALYPIITLVLTYILFREPINYQQGMGIFFSLLAIFFFSR